jgi:hypothetical protein
MDHTQVRLGHLAAASMLLATLGCGTTVRGASTAGLNGAPVAP